MKLIEQCPCGGRVELSFDEAYSRACEFADQHIEAWGSAHEPCLKRLGEPAAQPTTEED